MRHLTLWWFNILGDELMAMRGNDVKHYLADRI